MKKTHNMKFYIIAAAVVAVFLLALSACPPLEEDGETDKDGDGNGGGEIIIDDYLTAETITKDGLLDEIKWMDLLIDISEKKQKVHLDLSKCTGPDNGKILRRVHDDGSDYNPVSGKPGDYIQFNPLPDFKIGKDLIFSIKLPDVADMIANADKDEFDYYGIIESTIDASAFKHFEILRKVTGSRIELIGNFAFYNNKSLKEVDFPNAHHIREGAFYGCSALEAAIFNVALNISIRAFENCTNLKTVYIPTIGVEKDSTGLINAGAFKNCTSLTKMYFPYVKIIDLDAFYGCTSLTEVVFPSVTKIRNNAFMDCIKLEKAVFHANPVHTNTNHPLKKWKDDNTGKTGIFDDDSVVFFENAFRGCKALKELDVRYAWNVYFSPGSLAEVGESIVLYLYDDGGIDNSGKCFGHPQLDQYFGGSGKGAISIKSVKLSLPYVTPANSKVLNDNGNDPGDPGIKIDIETRYKIKVDVVKRAPVAP